MTTLRDTLTPTVLTSEASGVFIKVEQGVLYENNDEYDGSEVEAEKQDIPAVKYESRHPNNMESTFFNSMGDSSHNTNYITHSIFEPDFEIKAEPAVDIDDRQLDEESEENSSFQSQSPNESPSRTPKITVTPTSKLIALTNASHGKKRYACPYENCTKSYGKSSHLRSHLTWHTGIKPFVCKEPDCGKGFTRSDELNRHIRTHTGEKPFECVQCAKKFSRSDHLTKHLATHTKKSSRRKKIKLEKNSSQETLTLKSIEGPVDLKDNQSGKGMHTSESETNSNSRELTTDCSEATQASSLKINLNKSEDSCVDCITRFPKQEIKVFPSQTLPIKQQETNINMGTSALVKNEPLDESHELYEATYPNEPDDDAVMPEANLPPLPQHLKQTMNQMGNSVYDANRPFPCCRCTKNFKRQDDLNRHMRTHTGEKPFACNECDKRFMRSDHLKKHLNTHTRVR